MISFGERQPICALLRIAGIVVDDAHLVFCGRVDVLWLIDECG